MRSREWYDAVAAYLNQRLPASESHLRQRLTLAAAVLVALGAGFFAGRHTPALQPHAPVQGPREQAEVKPPSGPAFSATFYRDKDFKDLAFTRLHDSIAFDWKGDAPFGMDQADHFSVRWEGTLLVPDPGQYTFYLTSDDGSRLFIDDKLVVENWSDHSLVMLQGRADLTAGPHRLRVDYFDGLGMAAVRLEWSSEAFTRRLMTSADLR